MIPVKLASTGSSWTVTYADTTKRWYKYERSQWANAVILISSPSKTYAVGDTIKHEDISAYFVWIPKYKYKLFNMGEYDSLTEETLTPANQLIEIQFGTDITIDTDTSCTSPMISGESGNCAVGKWMSHPAFISLNKTGIWVGKFETSGLVSNETINSITVLPDNEPIRNVTTGEMFIKAYAYNTSLISHMMKNTEWGAVAYLAHSKYGVGNKNIYINNGVNNTMKTGCVGNGADTEVNTSTSCQNQWYSTTGLNGSTTGNITGIYDMSGGVWEVMASFRKNVFSASNLTAEDLVGKEMLIDIYDGDYTVTSYDQRILGDATGEMGPVDIDYLSSWHHDYIKFIAKNGSWFRRGGRETTSYKSGLFTTNNTSGPVSESNGFRLVLAP